MLPYRLRPPSYGAKLKRQKQQSESFLDRTHPYRDGGPLERAIKADLAALFANFEQELCISTVGDNDEGDITAHCRKGTAFATFKRVFGGARVAMLHRKSSSRDTTGFLLPRCDRNAYSQLLYSACFSLLRDAFCSTTGTPSSETVLLHRAAFAVFNLYTLYETNPLPRGTPKTAKDWLALLPMGLQNRDNPKMIYRRSFRQPIRIDIEHYGYLLRLRDLAFAAQARCRQKHCIAARSGKDNGGTTVDSAAWKCECAVAKDVEVVLGRMLSSNGTVDLCAYTGPCGLEGLAGHADYPFPATEGGTSSSTTRSNVGTAFPSAQHAPGDTSQMKFSSDLEQYAEAYLSSRNAIRLPPVQPNMSLRAKRIRESLLPVYLQGDQDSKPAIQDPLLRLLAVCRGKDKNDDKEPPQKRIKLRHRHVTFGTVIINGAGSGISIGKTTNESVDKGDTTSLTGDHDANAAAAADSQPLFELILPSDSTSEQLSSLHDAVQTLLDRDDSLLLSLRDGGREAPSHIEGFTNDGVSTLGDGPVSTVGSSVADAGRVALRELLSRIKMPTNYGGESAGDFFLASGAAGEHESALTNGDTDEMHLLSDLSSDEDNDEVSVAASRVGQRALEKLLSSADRKSNRTSKDEAGTTSKRKSSTRTRLPQKPRDSTKDADQPSSSDSSRSRNADSDRDSECSSAVSSVEAANQGRDALNALLSQARRTNGRNSSV